jgi:hypothetical protein
VRDRTAGPKLAHGWFASADFEIVSVMEMSGQAAATAIAIALAPHEANVSRKTNPRLTEAKEALRKGRGTVLPRPSLQFEQDE